MKCHARFLPKEPAQVKGRAMHGLSHVAQSNRVADMQGKISLGRLRPVAMIARRCMASVTRHAPPARLKCHRNDPPNNIQHRLLN